MTSRLKKIFIFLFVSISLSGQNNTDSLKLAFKNAIHDTTRCNILNRMIEAENDDEVWPKYNDQLLKLAHAALASKQSNHLQAFYIRQKSNAFNNIGYLASTRGEIDKALLYYTKALQLQEEINDKIGIAGSLNNIGYLYNHLGDIPKALEYYHRCLSISEKLNDELGVSIVLNNLGLIYVNLEEIPKAIEYYKKSLKICKEIKDEKGIGSALNNIGGAYHAMNDIPKALEYYNRSFTTHKANNDKVGMATSLNNIGFMYHNKKELKEALSYYEQALALEEDIKDKSDIAHTTANIAHIKLEQGSVKDAFVYANKSFSAATDLGYPDNIGSAANILKVIYRKQNRHKEAFKMYELEIKMRDSINNQETKKVSIKKQFQYAYEKQAAEDSVKHAEAQKVTNAQLLAQEAQLAEEKTQRVVLYGGLALMLAGSGLVFNRFRLTQKQKKVIEQQKEEVGLAYDQLHAKNKEVMDSINYASRIQNSLLPTEKYISKNLSKNQG